MGMMYKENNVFEEAIERINMIFDHCDDIIVSMSGGKDSTVAFHLALDIAKERGRLPLKVFWLDQEAEWQHTVDYMDYIMRMPEVKPLWFQIPFEFPNNLALGQGKESLLIWDPEEENKWLHPHNDITITEVPFDFSKNRDKAFYYLMDKIPEYFCDENATHCGVISGMRNAESHNRRAAISFGKANFMGETWARSIPKGGRCQVFWPIYDFTNDDIWTAIAKNHWKYNKVYDFLYQAGTPKNYMRVSALIHEIAYGSIAVLQEFEPETYKKFTARVAGTSAMSHAFDTGWVDPGSQSLPFMFKDWKEYRDYLLVHIIEPKYWEHYRREWKGQDDEDWYRNHVSELIVNDTCGTINTNEKSARMVRDKVSSGKYAKRELDNITTLMKEGYADVYKGTAD